MNTNQDTMITPLEDLEAPDFWDGFMGGLSLVGLGVAGEALT